MNRYLLDTNTCIEYLRGSNPRLVARLRSKKPSEIRLCSIVLSELFHGAYRSADPAANLKLVIELADAFISFAFDDRAAEAYGGLRRAWRKRVRSSDRTISRLRQIGFARTDCCYSQC